MSKLIRLRIYVGKCIDGVITSNTKVILNTIIDVCICYDKSIDLEVI